MMSRRGLALLVVAGVLGVLAVLSAAFVTLSRLERRSSAQRIFQTRALLLARSGLEDAACRLSAAQDSCYAGEDFDDDGSPTPAPGVETDAQVFHPSACDRDCPVEFALRPSYFVRDPAGTPALGLLDGKARGHSGELGAGRYALRVVSGAFYVNGGDPASPSGAGYNAVLRRMLGTLAEALGREGEPVAQADGWSLVDARPVTGWKDLRQIRDLALGGSRAKLEALEPYLSLHAWVDLKVVAPDPAPLSALTNQPAATWAAIRTASGRTAPGFETLAGKTVGRAPVSLAWARRRRPALLALLGGLEGVYLDESTAQLHGWGATPTDSLGTLRSVKLSLAWTGPDDCHPAAATLLASTSDLSTWGRWNDFCDTLPMTGTSDVPLAKRDLLKAAFNPNTDLNKFSPDPSQWKWVDKSDLRAYSTELSLEPSGGGRVHAVGRVVDDAGRVLARRRLWAEIAPHRRTRLTTQGEFVAGDLGRLDLAGDEGAFRAYGAAGYISPSLGTGRTFGHALTGDAGVSLQTAPEPHTVAVPAAWDGQVRLATVETADGQWGGTQTFLARWEKGFDASVSAGSPSNLADAQQAPPSASLWEAGKPGTLHPDGAYGEHGRHPGFLAAGNLPPNRGVLSYWLKPNYDPTRIGVSRRHVEFNATRCNGTVVYSSGFPCMNKTGADATGSTYTAYFTIAHARQWGPFYGMTQDGFTACIETSYGQDSLLENHATTPTPNFVSPHRWLLQTVQWDLHQPQAAEALHFALDRGLGAGDGSSFCYLYPTMATSDVVDYAADDVLGKATFFLGRRGGSPYYNTLGSMPSLGGADATFDEYLICDFGASSVAAWDQAKVLAHDRFEEGRFYKESDYAGLEASPGMNRAGSWTSAPIDLGEAELLRVSWTAVVPDGLRGPGGGAKPEDGDPGPEGAVVLELADVSGLNYLKDAQGIPVSVPLERAEGHPVLRCITEPLRLRAVFRPNLSDPDGTAILDPLALDDVTVTWRPAGGGGFLAWGEDPD